ncbi:tyrosine-type recombinase/integrase [Psychrobacillus sp.]|uniref:tyrosine-type recombinase/integrase n=1 Tax=Psychrobacillus sp. TaxID=1871623 RepID=UPI0028BDAFFF|nr:tyrosine-type recombinase/integrase [Psychrobacillus sp.]
MASYEELKPTKTGVPGIKITVEKGYDEETGERLRFFKTVRMKTLSDRAIKKAITEFEIEVANKDKTVKLEKINFGNFVERWMVNYVEIDLSVATKNDYKYHLDGGILDELKDRKLASIKTFHLVECINKWKENSVSMAIQKYVVLKSIFAKAVEWGLLKENPMKELKRPRVEKRHKELEFYDEYQLERLFEVLEHVNKRHKIQIKLTVLTGLRIGELGGMRIECIDFNKNTILINKSLQYDKEKKKLVLGSTKNKKARVVDIPDKFIEELKSYVVEQETIKNKMGRAWSPMIGEDGEEINFLFCRDNGYPQNPRSAAAAWDRIVKKYELPKISFHNLRHSYASYSLSKGVNIKIIQEQLGHSDINLTIGTYSHLTERDKSNASNIFNNLL